MNLLGLKSLDVQCTLTWAVVVFSTIDVFESENVIIITD